MSEHLPSTHAHAAATAEPLPAVCVVGNLNLDLIIRGVETLPTWGHEIAGTSHATVTSGQGGYVQLGLARMGVPTIALGNVGDDEAGRGIVAELRAAGVDVDDVEVSAGQTGITVGLVRPDGERAFVSDFACLRDLDEALVARRWAAAARAEVVALVGLYSLPGLDAPAGGRILARARAEGKLTVLDTGWDPDGWRPETVAATRAALAHVDVFLPNLDEATVLTGERDPLAAARALQADGPDLVVVKQGGEGSVAVRGEQAARVAAIPVAVVDAVGAGDAFDAAFLFAHLSGWDLAPSIAFASAAAGVYVSRETDRHAAPQEARAAAEPLGVALPSVPNRPARRGGQPT